MENPLGLKIASHRNGAEDMPYALLLFIVIFCIISCKPTMPARIGFTPSFCRNQATGEKTYKYCTLFDIVSITDSLS